MVGVWGSPSDPAEERLGSLRQFIDDDPTASPAPTSLTEGSINTPHKTPGKGEKRQENEGGLRHQL
eukprot:SAG11_NODE_22895_length_398_cov_1.193980_1_plen_65_part_01